MENWSEVMSFTYPHEAQLAKAKLESENIEVILKDELTTQVNNFYSNAIGGVKLCVKDKDVSTTKALLIDGGFLNNTPSSPSNLYQWFDSFSSNFPIIGSKIIEVRVLVFITLILTILVSMMVTLTSN